MLIKIIFRIIGAAEATANLLWVFNIAEKKDDKLTNIKNGNVILVKSIASLTFSLSSVKPGAIKPTKVGIKISITRTKNSRPKNNKLKIPFANIFALDLLLTNSEA